MRYGKGVVAFFAAGVMLLTAYLCVNHFTTSTAQDRAMEVAPRQESLQLTVGVERNEYGFDDITFSDRGKAWAVGYDGRDPQKLIYSEDGGMTWRAKVVSTGGYTLTGITFATAQEGWAVGNNGTIVHTSNGGETWKQMKRPTESDLNEVQFATSQVGYIAGMTEWGYEILHTMDGGQSWQKVYEEPKGGYVFQIAPLGEKIAVAAINDAHLLRTEDGGTTWRPVDTTLPGAASVVFTSDGTGWAVGRKGSFYRSTDQGRTWQRPDNLPQSLLGYDWSSIDFSDEKRGLAVGANGVAAVTYDGGATWSEKKVSATENLGLVRLHNGGGVVLGSQKVYSVTLAPHLAQR